MERIHKHLSPAPPFEATGASLMVDAPAGEVYKTAASRAFIDELIQHVRAEWPGYTGTFVCPRNSFAGVDDLQVFFEVDPDHPPTAAQVRRLCQLQPAAGSLQRVAVYLLLPNGAYLLERKSPLEFWHVILSPAANPDVFELLGRGDFLKDGAPRPAQSVIWTRFAETLVGDELKLRRTAMAKAMTGGGGPSSPLPLLRGIWRQLQLEVIDRSIPSGTVRIPLTVAAIRRGIAAWGIPDLPILSGLERAYRMELDGQPSEAAQLIPQAISLFQGLMQPRAENPRA